MVLTRDWYNLFIPLSPWALRLEISKDVICAGVKSMKYFIDHYQHVLYSSFMQSCHIQIVKQSFVCVVIIIRSKTKPACFEILNFARFRLRISAIHYYNIENMT